MDKFITFSITSLSILLLVSGALNYALYFKILETPVQTAEINPSKHGLDLARLN